MRIVIEADSIAADKMSGIGHATLEIIKFLSKVDKSEDIRTTIVVPFAKKNWVINKYGLTNIKVRTLPPAYRYVNYALTRTGIPAFMDLVYGKGIYIFPNYKNWPLLYSKSLTFIDDLAFKLYPETINPKNLTYLESNIERWLKRTDKILTISHSSEKDIKNFFPQYADKINIVHLGVNDKVYFKRDLKSTNAVLKRYNLPNKFILYVGNIEPRKNILTLLEAYKKYCDANEHPLPLLLVGGDGWNNDGIKQRINNLTKEGYKISVPKQYIEDEDMPFIYSAAALLTHLAVHEGFGLTVTEALSTKTPVLLSDIDVLREVAGDAGVYVKPDDIMQIANGMKDLTYNKQLRNQLIDRGIKRSKLFTWSSTVNKLIEIIRNL